MLKKVLLTVLAATLWMGQRDASANIVTYEATIALTGWDSSYAPGVMPNDVFSLSFAIDHNATTNNGGVFFDAISGTQLSRVSGAGTWVPDGGTFQNYLILSDDVSGEDQVQMIFEGQIGFPLLNGEHFLQSMTVTFVDPTNSTISSPGSDGTVRQFMTGKVFDADNFVANPFIDFSLNPGTGAPLFGLVTSITGVPEPGALGLTASAIAMILLRRRRR